MALSEDISRLGFRRWYERQLYSSFAYLGLSLLSLFLLLAGFEGLSALRGAPTYYLGITALAAGGGLIALICWRRFFTLFARAELFAGDAACPRCQSWGKFAVVNAEPESIDQPPEAGLPHWLRVRCRQCGENWRLG